MNTCLRILTAAALGACSPLTVLAGSGQPGRIDFGSFPPAASGGQFVEVNVSRNLLNLAARIASREDPEIARLLGQIESVRVNVVALDESNRQAVDQRVADLRRVLEAEGWEKTVSVQDGAQDVGVHLFPGSDEAIRGVVVTVVESKGQAVFVNVVGDIRPEQLASIGERLGIDPLRQLDLEDRG